MGPILGGALYVSLGHFAPAVMGMLLVAAAIAALHKGLEPADERQATGRLSLKHGSDSAAHGL